MADRKLDLRGLTAANDNRRGLLKRRPALLNVVHADARVLALIITLLRTAMTLASRKRGAVCWSALCGEIQLTLDAALSVQSLTRAEGGP